MTNEHEMRARARKAYRLADVLIAHGSGSRSAASLPEAGRLMVAELAGVRAPSAATWALVVEIMGEVERRNARLARMWVETEQLPAALDRPGPVNVEALVA